MDARVIWPPEFGAMLEQVQRLIASAREHHRAESQKVTDNNLRAGHLAPSFLYSRMPHVERETGKPGSGCGRASYPAISIVAVLG